MSNIPANEIQEYVFTIIRDYTFIRSDEEIKLESNLYDDLALDSLDIIEMVFAIEDKFNITIPIEEENITTVKDIIDIIILKLNK